MKEGDHGNCTFSFLLRRGRCHDVLFFVRKARIVFLSDMGACLLHLRSYQGCRLRLFEYCKPRSPCYSTASDAHSALIFPVVSVRCLVHCCTGRVDGWAGRLRQYMNPN